MTYVAQLMKQTCLQFARSTPIDRLPTLLRRIARDLDELPPHLVLGLSVSVSYELDEATVVVFLNLDDSA